MRYIEQSYDILKENSDKTDNLLLLHSSLIYSELDKIYKNSPFYFINKNGEKQNVLIFNKPIESLKATDEMKYYIPENTPILVGGPEGKYYIESLGVYNDEEFRDLTCDIGYRVIDKSTGNLITTGKDLGFLGKNIARLDNLIITKNVIFTNNEPAVYNDKSGYVMIFFKKNNDEKDYKFILYDNEGKCVEINYDYRTVCKIASNAPDVIMPELLKDGKLFEQMIMACLKDKKELIDCEADNLIDIVKYLEEHGLELALDLTSLKVYKVNYKKHFNRIKAKENSQDAPKLVRNKKTEEVE